MKFLRELQRCKRENVAYAASAIMSAAASSSTDVDLAAEAAIITTNDATKNFYFFGSPS